MPEIRSVELPRVVTPQTRQRLGIGRSRMRTELRRGSWQRLAPGVILTRPDEPTREDWADVGIGLAGPDGALTGWDALSARGLGGRRPPSPLVVVLSRCAQNRVVGGVRIRRTDRAYRRHVQPLDAPYELVPVVTVPRAVTDAALECRDLGAARALVSEAIQRRRCSIGDLLAEYAAGPRNRSRLLRVALSDVRDGARSAAEATAARRLDRAGIPPFELNVAVVTPTGRLLFVLDVLWRELRAGLEIDSREYHFGEQEWQATMRRHNQLTGYGLAITHYAPNVITARRSTFAAEVADWLRRRAAELGVPLPRGRGVRRPALDTAPRPLVVRPNA